MQSVPLESRKHFSVSQLLVLVHSHHSHQIHFQLQTSVFGEHALLKQVNIKVFEKHVVVRYLLSTKQQMDEVGD